MLQSPDLTEYEQFMRKLCAAAAEVIRPQFRNPALPIESKPDDTPVTLADRRAEERMRELIEATYPAHGIIGEEYGSVREDAELCWVLDPIDGTKSFAAGCPLFGTLVCLLFQGKPVLGAINQPILGQLMIGDGERTLLNDQPVRLRPCARLGAATLLSTDLREVSRYQDGAAFEKLLAGVKMVRTWGDCYGYLLLASGYADIMLDAVMAKWDLLSLVPIVRGAGGVITDWQGKDPESGTSIVAAAAELHAEVIALLNP
jgi:myo-inositol-1(or 4)-monophosphatase